MRKFFTLLSLVLFFTLGAQASPSTSKIREYARFLSDRMAYELDLTGRQYDDCYEINYDFLYAVAPMLDDIALGYVDAIDAYYRQLDYRNDDLRYILSVYQYERFMDLDYFYRPINTHRGSWQLRIYSIYSNVNFFYFDAPSVFKVYVGGHSRIYHPNGFYVSRHSSFAHYDVYRPIHGSDRWDHLRRRDFGANLRNRNGSKYEINNYNNRNQSNRVQDHRYNNNSGNVNSSEINKRNEPGYDGKPVNEPKQHPSRTVVGTRTNNAPSSSSTSEGSTRRGSSSSSDTRSGNGTGSSSSASPSSSPERSSGNSSSRTTEPSRSSSGGATRTTNGGSGNSSSSRSSAGTTRSTR